jgi:hypothetical protein
MRALGLALQSAQIQEVNMNAEILSTEVVDGIAVVTLGSPKRLPCAVIVFMRTLRKQRR